MRRTALREERGRRRRRRRRRQKGGGRRGGGRQEFDEKRMVENCSSPRARAREDEKERSRSRRKRRRGEKTHHRTRASSSSSSSSSSFRSKKTKGSSVVKNTTGKRPLQVTHLDTDADRNAVRIASKTPAMPVKRKEYAFDAVFDAQSTNEQVYRKRARYAL